MSEVVLNVVPKNIEIQHVAENVQPRPVQKHRREEGKRDYRKRVPGRTCKKRRQMRRHHAKLPDQKLQAPRVQGELKEKNHHIQPDQKTVHPGSAVPRLVVAKGKHKESGNVVIE